MSAVLSPCKLYRYTLERREPFCTETDPYVGFLLCNPSTADANLDDQTVRKGRGFSNAWGFKRFMFGNVCGYRATDPDDLLAFKGDRVGPENEYYLKEIFGNAALVVVAWGAALPKVLRPQARWTVDQILRPLGKPIKCLGMTKDHQPKHPLTLAYSTPLQDYRP